MSDPIKLASVEFAEVPVTSRTTWVMAEIGDSEGVIGLVEISPIGAFGTRTAYDEMVDAIARLKDRPIGHESGVPEMLGVTLDDLHRDFALATAVSGLRSAVAQIQAEHDAVTLTETLGGERKDSVQLYANINRSMLDDRSPAAFAAAAEWAVGRGFEIVKCAPFDEVDGPPLSGDIMETASAGIERVSAIRTAVGEDVTILVDCHRRFDEATAPIVCAKLAELGIGWFEEPVDPETEVHAHARIAAAVTVPVAGGEHLYGRDLFDNLIAVRAVETVMPDVKHCGGVGEAVVAGRSAIEAGGKYSLHSPSGPVSLLASAHATAAVEGASPLEHAVNEADWRSEVLAPAERIEDGRLWLPDGFGLGATLDADSIDRRGRRWKP